MRADSLERWQSLSITARISRGLNPDSCSTIQNTKLRGKRRKGKESKVRRDIYTQSLTLRARVVQVSTIYNYAIVRDRT